MGDKAQTALMLAIIPLVIFVSNMVSDGLDKHSEKPCHAEACEMLAEMNRNVMMNNCLIMNQAQNVDLSECNRIQILSTT